jgi:hypothetical protein
LLFRPNVRQLLQDRLLLRVRGALLSERVLQRVVKLRHAQDGGVRHSSKMSSFRKTSQVKPLSQSGDHPRL